MVETWHPPAKAATIQARPRSAKARENSAGTRPSSGYPVKPSVEDTSGTLPEENGLPNRDPSTSTSQRLARRDITIHVYDENRNSKRDFHCKKSVLLREMRYFASYIDEKNAGDYVDIDVHCDIEVFEWLMAHVSRGKKDGPQLGLRTVVSILISSDFLQMAKLTEDCLNYCHENLSEIVKIPLDMSCIGQCLLDRLASKFTLADLEKVIDIKNKIISKLYLSKLGALLSNPANPLQRCSSCHKLYSQSAVRWLECKLALPKLEFIGERYTMHEQDKSFNVNTYVSSLCQKGLSWKEIYYRVWGFVTHLDCSTCHSKFPAREFSGCVYHPAQEIYPAGEGNGFHPCCLKPVYRFHPFSHSSGCLTKDHTVRAPTESSPKQVENIAVFDDVSAANDATVRTILDTLNRNREIIVRPPTKTVLSYTGAAYTYAPFFNEEEKSGSVKSGSDESVFVKDTASTGSSESFANPPAVPGKTTSAPSNASVLGIRARSARWAQIGRTSDGAANSSKNGATISSSSLPARRRRAILDAFPEQDRKRMTALANTLLGCRIGMEAWSGKQMRRKQTM